MSRSGIRAIASHVIRTIVEEARAKKMIQPRRRDTLASKSIQEFKRLEPLDFGGDDWWIFNPDELDPTIIWPIDVGTVQKGIYDKFIMRRVVSVTARQCRGVANKFSPYMLKTEVIQEDRGQLFNICMLHAWLNNCWVEAAKSNHVGLLDCDIYPDKMDEKTSEILRKANASLNAFLSIALRQRYEWAIILGHENTPSVRFATDPTGLKELLRLREIRQGAFRRDAVLNWVVDHWRQNRADKDCETYVRRHMRGGDRFEWEGFQVEIVPAEFDVELAQRHIIEREELKSKGLHIRRKVV